MQLPDRPAPIPPETPRTGEETVERLIFASVVAQRQGIYATMETIRDAALRHNPSVGIHSTLIYQSGWFIHWAKGPRVAVRALADRLATDRRHRAPLVVHYSLGPRNLTSPWSMALGSSSEGAAEMGRRVMHLRACMAEGLQFRPTSVIRRLTMPMRLPQALRLPDPEKFHRVGLVAATGASAYDLVGWLSSYFKAERYSLRVAGERGLDTASDYVDFLRQELPCRVLAVSRVDLRHGMRRAFLPEWRFIALLFSGSINKDAELVDLIDFSLRGLPSAPQLMAFAPDEAALERVASHAAAKGLRFAVAEPWRERDHAALWARIDRELGETGVPDSSGWYESRPDPTAP